MTNKRQKRTKKDLINESETNISENLNRQFKWGDLTWVKIRDSAWWPAQVVDEETVSNKPKKESKDEILCRLYGTCEYAYVNAWKSNIEFGDALKRDNLSMKEKFQEVVKEDISLMKLKVKSNRKASKSKDIDIAEASKENKKQSKLTQESIESSSDISVTKLNVKSKSKASKSKDTDIAEASKPKKIQSNLPQESFQIVSAIQKKEDSIKGKRKLDFSEENREETNPKSESSKQKNLINTKKQKITNQDCNFSKDESKFFFSPTKSESSKEKTLITDKKHKITENLNWSCNFSNEDSEKLSSPKINEINASIETKSASKSENEEAMKAKDIEIRKIVRDILYGENTPKKDQTPKKDSNAKSKNIKAKNDLMVKKSEKKKYELKAANLNSNEEEKMIKSVGVRGKKEKTEKKNETKNSKNLEKKNIDGVPKDKCPDLETITPSSCRDVGLVPVPVVQSEEKGSLSQRKIRVMQNLALIAPLGSPFGKNGLIDPSS